MYLRQTWKRHLIMAVVVLSVIVVVFAQGSLATSSRKTELLQYDKRGEVLLRRTLVFPEGFQGGASIDVFDADADGDDDYIIGAGPGGGPQVVVMRGNGKIIKSFLAYDQTMHQGVNVAAGDLNGDGNMEIVTVPAYGASHVRVFDKFGNPKFVPFGFDAFNGKVTRGATVTLADRDGDGRDEIYVGSGVGTSGHVRGFDRFGEYIGVDYFPWASSNRGGVQVASGNVDERPGDELIMGIMTENGPTVKVYKLNRAKTVISEFQAFPESLAKGVRVSAADLNHDGIDEIIVSAGPGSGNHVRTFDGDGTIRSRQFFPNYERDFRGGTWAVAGDTNGDGEIEFAVIPTRVPLAIANARENIASRGGSSLVGDLPESGKAIEVDLSEQRLYVYEDAVVKRSFLISSGIRAFPTPEGSFTVDAKIYKKDYQWTYGPEDPLNYDIPNVYNNLRFSWPYYIHAAYWHNNFGRPMSHGCINMDEPDAEWVYNWATVGIPVLIHP